MKRITEASHAKRIVPFVLSVSLICGCAVSNAAETGYSSVPGPEMTESYLEDDACMAPLSSYADESDSYDDGQSNGTADPGKSSEFYSDHSYDSPSDLNDIPAYERANDADPYNQGEPIYEGENNSSSNYDDSSLPQESVPSLSEDMAIEETESETNPDSLNEDPPDASTSEKTAPEKPECHESKKSETDQAAEETLAPGIMPSETVVTKPSDAKPDESTSEKETEALLLEETDSTRQKSEKANSESSNDAEPAIPKRNETGGRTESEHDSERVISPSSDQSNEPISETDVKFESEAETSPAKEPERITETEDSPSPTAEMDVTAPSITVEPESELLCESEPAYETISEIQCESETETITENPGSYSNANTACYRSGNYGYHTGTFRYRKSLTKEQRIENLRVGFHKSAEENYALCDAKNWVDVHMGRGTDTEVVGKLYPGDLCYILADSDDQWVYIESGNVRGFIFSYYLTSRMETDDPNNNERANHVQLAEEVMDPLQNKAFRYSLLTNGTIATTPYVESEVIEDGVSEGRASLLNLAASYEGYPYEWGGNDPQTGFDCSGFVKYVYSQFGVDLPRTAEQQAYTGTKITVEDALPGDLVFMMDSTGYIYHVVIYAGDGKALEARGSNYGVGCFDLDYGNACWAVRLIHDGGINVSTGRIDGMNYTQDQLELIWAIVAQEDNGSYEGALAVITSAMNRADENYGGFGQNALAQLTAPGQYCFSHSVSDPGYYQARLGGNVPDYVKDAVYDCLVYGDRNHGFLNFRSTNGSGGRTQIGGNWFF